MLFLNLKHFDKISSALQNYFDTITHWNRKKIEFFFSFTKSTTQTSVIQKDEQERKVIYELTRDPD